MVLNLRSCRRKNKMTPTTLPGVKFQCMYRRINTPVKGTRQKLKEKAKDIP